MLVIDAIVKIFTALAPFAWPGATLIVALLFRKELTGILGRLRNAKLPGGSEVAFDRLLDATEAESPPDPDPDRALPPEDSADRALSHADDAKLESGAKSPSNQYAHRPEPQSFDRRHLSQVGKQSPEAAIMLAFRHVETELAKALGSDQFVPPLKATQELLQRGRLSHADAMFLNDLRMLRNVATHEGVQGLTYGDVTRYLRLIEDFLSRLAPREVVIKNNAVVAGAFPPNGPWRRSGNPPLEDGNYQIVRHADGTWRLANNPDIVIFQPVFSRPD